MESAVRSLADASVLPADADDETLDSLLGDLAGQAARSTSIIRAHELSEVGQPGERWGAESPATLERVLFHMLAEYARHVGHLDVVCEIVTGQFGE